MGDLTNKVLGVLVALLLIVLVPNFKSCFLCISSPVELRSLTTPLFAKHILRRDWKVKLWDNLFSRIYKKKLPNLLCNISPSNEVLPLNAINCSKKKNLWLSQTFMEGALWWNLASYSSAHFSSLQGQNLHFPASFAAGYGHRSAFGQHRVSGDINLYHVRVGSQILPIFDDQDDRVTGRRSMALCITAWRRDAHLLGTHILSYQVRRHKLELC